MKELEIGGIRTIGTYSRIVERSRWKGSICVYRFGILWTHAVLTGERLSYGECLIRNSWYDPNVASGFGEVAFEIPYNCQPSQKDRRITSILYL